MNKKTKLSIIITPLVVITFLANCGSGGTIKRWFEYEDWWNHCSNGKDGEQATLDDVGKEVKISLNNLNHLVKLIDCNHDKISGGNDETAHCTFEFTNVITNDYGTIFMPWNNEEGYSSTNFNYPESTLNKLLNDQNNDNSIINMFPTGLKETIKLVDKSVGVNEQNHNSSSFPCKLFPLAHEEMMDQETGVTEGEGTLYKYYVGHSSVIECKEYRIKKAVNSKKDDGDYYWLRSPSISTNNRSFDVSSDGTTAIEVVYSNPRCGVAPAFCI